MESKISMQEENAELDERVEEEEDDDSDGPPPGFQWVITQQLYQPKKDEVDEEENEGPPPGFHSIAPKPSPALHSSDEDNKDQDVDDDDDDRPPPGWEFFSMANALPKPPSNSADANLKSNAELNEGESDGDSDDEGPPPGWEKVLHHRMPPSCTPPLQASQAVSSDCEMGSQQETSKNNDEMPQSDSRWTPLPLLGQSLAPTPQLQQLPPSASPAEAGSKGETKDVDKMPTSGLSASPKQSVPAESGSNVDTKNMEKNPTSVPDASPKQSVPAESGSKGDTKDVDKRPKSVPAASPKQSVPSASHPSTPNMGSSSSEKAQLVCGTCRKLLLYPRGAKWVQCPDCQEVNFVLEAHEVGQVKCGNCGVLLMYPHGAPAVQCTSCSFITEIGADNRRPPLSVQMAQRRRRRGRAR